MSRVPTVRGADLDRVFKALAKAGLTASQIVVRPGGEVVISPQSAQAPGLTDEQPAGEVSDLERFRAEKKQRGLRAAQGS